MLLNNENGLNRLVVLLTRPGLPLILALECYLARKGLYPATLASLYQREV